MAGAVAGRELCRFLADPARPYREMWEQRGAAYRGRPLNQSSIAKVVAAYLVDQGLLAEFEEGDWPRSRRDWIRSRLAGEMMTHLELELFMAAFMFLDEDREQLRVALQAGSPPLLPDEIRLDGLPARDAYELVRTFDEQRFGADGLPACRRTSVSMRALRDGVDALVYLLDTEQAVVVVSAGGTASRPQRVGTRVWAVVITLDEPLLRGDVRELEYETTFDYQEQPAPLCRRLAPGEDREVQMVMTFHPARLPRDLHVSTWAAVMDADPITSVRVGLDDAHSASATWTVARSGLIGFSWEW